MLFLVAGEMKNENFVIKQVDKDQITTVERVQNWRLDCQPPAKG